MYVRVGFVPGDFLAGMHCTRNLHSIGSALGNRWKLRIMSRCAQSKDVRIIQNCTRPILGSRFRGQRNFFRCQRKLFRWQRKIRKGARSRRQCTHGGGDSVAEKSLGVGRGKGKAQRVRGMVVDKLWGCPGRILMSLRTRGRKDENKFFFHWRCHYIGCRVQVGISTR